MCVMLEVQHLRPSFPPSPIPNVYFQLPTKKYSIIELDKITPNQAVNTKREKEGNHILVMIDADIQTVWAIRDVLITSVLR